MNTAGEYNSNDSSDSVENVFIIGGIALLVTIIMISIGGYLYVRKRRSVLERKYRKDTVTDNTTSLYSQDTRKIGDDPDSSDFH